ncbi:MAG: hypothetical protein Q9191_006405 [Dirinaria sp. TL-2023a]
MDSQAGRCPVDLDEEEILALEEESLILRKAPGQKRKISSSLLTPPSSGSPSSLSSANSTASVSVWKVASTNSGFVLPESYYSADTVAWCGFAPEAANTTFTRWSARSEGNDGRNPDDLIDYMVADIRQVDFKDELTEDEQLNRMPLKETLKSVLRDPKFESVRSTADLRYWIINTITINYETLWALKSRVKTIGTAAAHSRAKKKPKLHASEIFTTKPASPNQPASPPTSSTASILSSINDFSLSQNLPKAHVRLVTRPPLPKQDHIILYKAKAAVEMQEWIDSEGNVDLKGLETYSGGDFDPRTPAYYFTLEKDTAERYRQWTAERCTYADTWLIEIQVPRAFIDQLRYKEIWYGFEWKEYVWYCRRQKVPPAKYDDLWKPGGVDLIKGHVCATASKHVARVASDAVQSWFNEGHVLHTADGQKSIQWSGKGHNGFLLEGAFMALLYALPIYFQAISDVSPAAEGVHNLPLLPNCDIGSFVAGLLISKFRRLVPFMVWASGGGCIGTGLIYTLDVNSPSSHWIGFQVLAGLAFGSGLPLAIIGGQVRSSTKDLRSTTAMLLFTFNVGSSLALAAAQSVLDNILFTGLPSRAPNVNPKAVILAGATEIRTTFHPDDVAGIVDAYLHGVRAVYIMIIALSGAGTLMAMANRWQRLALTKGS